MTSRVKNICIKDCCIAYFIDYLFNNASFIYTNLGNSIRNDHFISEEYGLTLYNNLIVTVTPSFRFTKKLDIEFLVYV